MLDNKFSIHGALSCSIQSTQCPGDFAAAVSTPKQPIYCSAVTNQRHHGLNHPPTSSCPAITDSSYQLHQTLPAASCCSESPGLVIPGAHLSQTVRERSRVLEGHKDAFEIAKEKKNSFVLSSCHCFFRHPPQHKFLFCQLERGRWQM